jgi:penicillin-binding protein 1C
MKRGRRRLLFAALLFVAPIVLWLLLIGLDPPPDPYRDKPASPQVLARDGTLLRAFTSPDEKWRLRTVVHRGSPFAHAATPVNPDLIAAVLEHEDRWFFRHPGVNPVSLARAAGSNLKSRRVVSGASTITMQLARLTRPGSRSIAYKLWQIYRALQYECLYSKQEILEAYLNLTPYGGNIEGVEAASRIYFGKSASELSIGEAALLAVIPQSPVRYHPLRRPREARSARDRLIQRLRERGRIDEGSAREAVALPLPARPHALPFLAPHLAERVSRERALPQSGAHLTTVDGEIQQRLESLVKDYVRDLRPLGIGQGAAVILDYQASELIALVGSADFFDVENEGQVNGALAPRSPGSTLKPFAYALAIDRGLITPDTMVEDVPMHLGAYEPENFDHEYLGAMSAAQALRTSRNVPAVRLARELRRSGGRGLYELLTEAGIGSLRHGPEHYGLSLVLGGGEIPLFELAKLYATLARHGDQIAIAELAGGEPRGVDARLFSPESAWLVLDILTEVTRPELGAVWRSGRRMIPVPWKTGTSFGHRDAWAVGIAGKYVVGVWIGNFDGAGVPHLQGIETAAPLLFDIVDALPHDEPGTWHLLPQKLALREICATSGLPPGAHCPHTQWGDYIPGISPAPPCDIHREILVDMATGYTICSRCRGEGTIRRQVVEWWPNRVAQHLRSHSLSDLRVPPHHPRCRALEPGSSPHITSPQEEVVYYLRPGVPIEDQMIALSASVSRGTHQVFWFLDGILVWKGTPGRPVFVNPEIGLHDVCVKDDSGRSATRVFRVRAPEVPTQS